MKDMTGDAAVFNRRDVEQYQVVLKRFVAFGLMLLSLSGTYLGLVNGVLMWRADMFVLAVFWQVLVSAFQFVHVPRPPKDMPILMKAKLWLNAWYLVPLLLSVAPTAAGYGVLLGVYIAGVLASWGMHYPLWGAYLIILLASLGIDIIPERILVRKG